MGSILEKLMNFFAQHAFPGELTAETPLQAYLDSLAMLDFIVFIEKEFSITIEDGEVTPKNFSNLASISEYINSKISK